MMRWTSGTFVASLMLVGATPAIAQSNASGLIPPVESTDSRGVNLTAGQATINIPLVSFDGNATLLASSLEIAQPGGGLPSPDIVATTGTYLSELLRPRLKTPEGRYSDEFGMFENIALPTGAGFFLYSSWHTNPDGSYYKESFGPSHVTYFNSLQPNTSGYYDSLGNRVIFGANVGANYDSFVFANGEEWRYYRQTGTLNSSSGPMVVTRLRSIVSSRGYAIQFLYMSDVAPTVTTPSPTWSALRRVTAYNKAFTFCDETLLQECAAVSSLASADFSYNNTAGTVTIKKPGQADGVVLEFTKFGPNWAGPIKSVRHTAIPNSTVNYEYQTGAEGAWYVSRITDGDGQWNYTYSLEIPLDGHVGTSQGVATDPSGHTLEWQGSLMFGQLIWRQTVDPPRLYNYFGGGPEYRENGMSYPEWNSTNVVRDRRNNVTQIVISPKPGSGQPDITVYSAQYPVHCTNMRTCNQPISTTDGNSNTTNYTYADHGGVLTVTGPLVPTRQNDGSLANVQPQKRYEYAQRYAWTSNGTGGYVQAASPVWLLVRERYCRTTASSGSTCGGGSADEVVTDYDYGPNAGPNTLLLRGIGVTADGDTLRTCFTYDAMGRKISETQPNAALASCP